MTTTPAEPVRSLSDDLAALVAAQRLPGLTTGLVREIAHHAAQSKISLSQLSLRFLR